VYLPEGEWYDLHTEKRYSGKQEIIVEAPLERLPVFVKGGTMLVMQSLVQTTKQQPEDVLTVHCFSAKQGSEFVYYEDAGEGFAHEQGGYYKRTITFDAAKKTLRFEKREGNLASKFKRVRLVMHGFEGLPQEMTVAGRKVVMANDTTPFIKPVVGFDPQAGQNAIVQWRGARSVVFPLGDEVLSVGW
jgi:alpha-glucosidase